MMAADYCLSFMKCGSRDVRHKLTIKADITIEYGPPVFACGRSPSFQVYSNVLDPASKKGKLSDKAFLDKFGTRYRKEGPERRTYEVKFLVETAFGRPGALVVENKHDQRFFLRSAVIDFGGEFNIYFHCRSWIYPFKKTKQPRVFFSNASYLPSQTPRGLKLLRENELKQLRGDQRLEEHINGQERQEWDRIYNYEHYNDLGDPDSGRDFARPILGGTQLPYPRRLHTGRPPSKQDVTMESPVARVYVPPDERFSPKKMSELKESLAKALWQFLINAKPETPSSRSFKTVEELFEVFENKELGGGLDSWVKEKLYDLFIDNERRELDSWMKEKLLRLVSPEFYQQIIDQENRKDPLDAPLPSIAAENKFAFGEDEEFARQMLAGTNPTRIRLLTKSDFPSKEQYMKGSKIERRVIDSIIAASWKFQAVFGNLDQAIDKNKVFVLDHHDYLRPYLRSINRWEVRACASRTLLLQTLFKTLEPVAIELSVPSSSNPRNECQADPRPFYKPIGAEDNIQEEAIWSLAKLHVASNDAAHHLLVTHWLHTHAVVEPFIIAARRQLSTMHPIHRLLDPHFKDTLHANAMARAMVINAGGVVETLCFTGEVSMELSSKFYKEWRFDEQALPKDLIIRGMAKPICHSGEVKVFIKEDPDLDIPDLEESDRVQLVLEDYPYAQDGLEIWSVIKKWVRSYCLVFYTNNDAVQGDTELQSWWTEVQERGHPDQKEGWYDIKTQDELIEALTTLIWICSAQHAAVNYGQYAYAGFPPNRPTLLHRLIPESTSEEYRNLQEDFEEHFCKTLPDRFEMGMVVALTYVMSQHWSDDLYLGQRETLDWTDNDVVKLKFDEFRENLKKIEKRILMRNRDFHLFNRWGTEAKIPYKLLYPDASRVDSKGGSTWRGIPNSISI